MNTLNATRASIGSGLTTSFVRFMEFVPTLVGAIIVLAVGWALALSSACS